MSSSLKTCRGCNEMLPLSRFYRHPAMGDGHLNFCQDCTKRRVARHRLKHLEHIREYDRTRNHLPHRVAARAARLLAFRTEHPEQRSAHTAVSNALRSGHLLRKPCQVCGCAKTEAHHEDYSRPLDVIWLCTKHHRQLHHGGVLVLALSP